VLPLDAGRDHHIFLPGYSCDGLGLQLDRLVVLTKHGHTHLDISDYLAEGLFDIGQCQPPMVDTVVLASINRTD
jgi:hypothetical protein